MTAVAQVFVALAGLLHLAIFAMESVLFRKPATWKRFLVASQGEAELIRPWAFNQGFYNLFLALGALGGLVAVWAGRETGGAAVALFACACMALAGTVLVLSDRRMARAATMQAGPPLLGLLLPAVL